MVAFSRLVLQEALVRGELPAWIDADRIASAFITLMDGFLVRAIESADLSTEGARREAYSLLELLLAAPATAPEAVEKLRGSRRSVRLADAPPKPHKAPRRQRSYAVRRS
jgi:hypothetical protein